MKYIVLMEQSGGCDYTIGCGKNWAFIEAENKKEALKKAFGDIDKIDESAANDPSYWKDENAIVAGLDEEGYPDSVEIFEVGETISEKECANYYRKVVIAFDAIEEKRAGREKEENEENDRKKYEELKKKFDK